MDYLKHFFKSETRITEYNNFGINFLKNKTIYIFILCEVQK
jgi:hypothetical protein